MLKTTIKQFCTTQYALLSNAIFANNCSLVKLKYKTIIRMHYADKNQSLAHKQSPIINTTERENQESRQRPDQNKLNTHTGGVTPHYQSVSANQNIANNRSYASKTKATTLCHTNTSNNFKDASNSITSPPNTLHKW